MLYSREKGHSFNGLFIYNRVVGARLLFSAENTMGPGKDAYRSSRGYQTRTIPDPVVGAD